MTYFLPMGEKVKYKRKIRQEQIWVVTSRSDKRNYKGKKQPIRLHKIANYSA